MNRLAPVTRAHLLIGAVAACATGLAAGSAALLSVVAGVALAMGNLWVIRRVARQAVVAAEAGVEGGAGRLVAVLIGKMAALFVAAWFLVSVLHLAVLPFAVGFSTLAAALVVAGERSFSPEEAR